VVQQQLILRQVAARHLDMPIAPAVEAGGIRKIRRQCHRGRILRLIEQGLQRTLPLGLVVLPETEFDEKRNAAQHQYGSRQAGAEPVIRQSKLQITHVRRIIIRYQSWSLAMLIKLIIVITLMVIVGSLLS